MDNESTPAGKRTIRITVRGSVMGYVAGKPWCNFGERSDPIAHERAEAWVNEV